MLLPQKIFRNIFPKKFSCSQVFPEFMTGWYLEKKPLHTNLFWLFILFYFFMIQCYIKKQTVLCLASLRWDLFDSMCGPGAVTCFSFCFLKLNLTVSRHLLCLRGSMDAEFSWLCFVFRPVKMLHRLQKQAELNWNHSPLSLWWGPKHRGQSQHLGGGAVTELGEALVR